HGGSQGGRLRLPCLPYLEGGGMAAAGGLVGAERRRLGAAGRVPVVRLRGQQLHIQRRWRLAGLPAGVRAQLGLSGPSPALQGSSRRSSAAARRWLSRQRDGEDLLAQWRLLGPSDRKDPPPSAGGLRA